MNMKAFITFIVSVITMTQMGWAQLNPSPSQYFHNLLFQNVAATGMDGRVRIDGAYRNVSPNTFVGAPVNQLFSIQGKMGGRSGIGLQFQQESAGLLNRSRILGSYALDLSSGQTRVRLGVGLGTMLSRINQSGGAVIRGEIGDPLIAAFNEQKMKVDGSIGALIETGKGWTIMTSIPSLGAIQEFSAYDGVDYTVLNFMVSKKLNFAKTQDGSVSVQPLLGYRLIKGLPGIVDMGAIMNYQGWIKFCGIYHSNNEVALGVGIPYKEKLSINFTYNTGKVYTKNYLNTSGTMELHLMLTLGKTKQ
jgi:type IX secretion system PorP/SprF family membrane protein